MVAISLRSVHVCPACQKPIADAEQQLAVQYYILDEPCDPEDLSVEALSDWFRRAEARYLLTEGDLYIQLADVLVFNRKKKKYRYYKRFAV